MKINSVSIKKAVITGATGAIGMALIETLIENEVEVLAIVRPDSKRIDQLPENRYLTVTKCGLKKLADMQYEHYGDSHLKYDAFFHFAWEGTIGDGRDDMYLQNQNVKYTLDAVHLAHRMGCKVFVGAGSQAEYGRVEEKISDVTPVNPENGYGMAKLCAGQMSRLECKKLEMKHIWPRILSVYGPYDGQNTMIISSIYKLLQKESPLFSPGEQLWDYIYSKDAARAIYLAARYGEDGGVYPIGSGQTRPLFEFIKEMVAAVDNGTSADIGALPYRDKQVMYLCADIDKLSKDTGFVPEVSFAEGIRHTIDWCKEVSLKTNFIENP